MPLTIQEKHKAITEILARFNFAKVHAVMVLTRHKWNLGGNSAVPTIERLRAIATDLLNSAWDSERAFSRGGFTAFCDGRELNLGYELESEVVEMEEAR